MANPSSQPHWKPDLSILGKPRRALQTGRWHCREALKINTSSPAEVFSRGLTTAYLTLNVALLWAANDEISQRPSRALKSFLNVYFFVERSDVEQLMYRGILLLVVRV